MKHPRNSWFKDPTFEAASRRQVKNPYPRIYVCSPFSGDTKTNSANAVKYCKYALQRQKMPICPHLYFPRFMNDGSPEQRELALNFGLRLLAGCAEVWVFGGEISAGMKAEIWQAQTQNIPIVYYTTNSQKIQEVN